MPIPWFVHAREVVAVWWPNRGDRIEGRGKGAADLWRPGTITATRKDPAGQTIRMKYTIQFDASTATTAESEVAGNIFWLPDDAGRLRPLGQPAGAAPKKKRKRRSDRKRLGHSEAVKKGWIGRGRTEAMWNALDADAQDAELAPILPLRRVCAILDMRTHRPILLGRPLLADVFRPILVD